MKFFVRIIAATLLISSLLTLSSCFGRDEREVSEYYPHHCELALTIPTTFVPFESSEFDAAFTDGHSIVGMIRISYANNEIPATFSPTQFADYYMRLSDRSEEIYKIGDVPYYTYTEAGYFNMLTFYCSKYAYFVVLYTCIEERAVEYTDDFLKYAAEAYFTQ